MQAVLWGTASGATATPSRDVGLREVRRTAHAPRARQRAAVAASASPSHPLGNRSTQGAIVRAMLKRRVLLALLVAAAPASVKAHPCQDRVWELEKQVEQLEHNASVAEAMALLGGMASPNPVQGMGPGSENARQYRAMAIQQRQFLESYRLQCSQLVYQEQQEASRRAAAEAAAQAEAAAKAKRKTSKRAGCVKDTDCKGDRICESGRCVNPAR